MFGFDINRECIIGSQKGRKMKIEVPKFEDITKGARSCVRNVRAVLANKNLPDDEQVALYREYIHSLNFRTTATMVAEHELPPVVDAQLCARNKAYLDTVPTSTKHRMASISRMYQANYPITGKLRKYIIDKERIVMDKTLRHRKYPLLRRLVIKWRLRNLRKIPPKS